MNKARGFFAGILRNRKKHWFIQRKHIVSYITLILILAFGLRFFQLEKRTLFSGEATNELLALEMLSTGKTPFLLGYPVATYIPNLYTTPWFWYLLLPLFNLFHGNPLVFIILHPLLGTLGIYFLYRAGKLFHSEAAGLFAAFIYATWMVIINLDRSVWNVGLIPFAVNLVLWAAVMAIKTNQKKFFVLLGVLLGLAISLHYQLIILTMGLLLWIDRKNRHHLPWAFLPIIFSFLPVLIYDVTHQFATAIAFSQAIRSLADGSRQYSTNYFFYQFYPVLILIFGVWLAKASRKIAVGLLTLFAFWQFNSFITYRVNPNYTQRKIFIFRLLTFWSPERGIIFLVNDRPYFEYGYLLLYFGRGRGVTADSITRFEHKDSDAKQGDTMNIKRLAVDLDGFSKSEAAEFINSGKAILVIDEDRLKLLAVSSGAEEK